MSVIITGPDGLDYPSKQDVLDIFDQVKKINYKGFAFELKPEAPLPEFSASPKPGRIKKEVVDKTNNTTTWKLADGATVIYKQVPEDRSRVCLRAVRPGGESMFSLQELPSAQVATTFVQAGGAGQLSSQQLNRIQQAKGFKSGQPYLWLQRAHGRHVAAQQCGTDDAAHIPPLHATRHRHNAHQRLDAAEPHLCPLPDAPAAASARCCGATA